MHHYPFHLGDYIRATAHLSIEEDCAYRRLLDLYYETEAPIPNETQLVSRRLRMGSQQAVIESILREFFILGDDNCWHKSRCDDVISAYQHQLSINKANGKLGGRPKKTESKPIRIAKRNRNETETKGNQEPETINQKPLTNGKSKAIAPSALLAMLGISGQLAIDYAKLREKKKAPITKTAMDGIAREAEKAGISFEDAVRVSCERGWAGFKADWYMNKPAFQTKEENNKAWFDEMTGRNKQNGRTEIDITPTKLD